MPFAVLSIRPPQHIARELFFLHLLPFPRTPWLASSDSRYGFPCVSWLGLRCNGLAHRKTRHVASEPFSRHGSGDSQPGRKTNMQTMSQRLFAAVAAVLGFGGLAAAQYTEPNRLPAIPLAPTQQVQMVQYQTLPQGPNQPNQIVSIPQVMPAQTAAPQTQPVQAVAPAPAATPGALVAASGTTGCSTCGNGVRAPNPYLPQNTAIGAGLAPVPYNETCAQCANGCGSIKSTSGFIFGSCKSFFNPCGPIPCGGACSGSHKCGKYPYGTPYGKGFNTCVYDSNLNH